MKVNQLAIKTLTKTWIAPLESVYYADLKPLLNSYIWQLVQVKWDVAVHCRYLYLLKPTLGPLQKFQYLTRTKEVVNTRLRFGHTKSHILSRGPPNTCHHCGHWPWTIYSLVVQCCRKIVANTTQMTPWILYSWQFLKLPQWNSCEKWDSSIWYERWDILFNPLLESSLNWCDLFFTELSSQTWTI